MEIDTSLSSSLEDYLEVIWDLEMSNTVARVKEISETLNVKRSSVTVALKTLNDKGLVNYEPYSTITLTEAGKSVGSNLRKRHNMLRTLFIHFGIDEAISDDAACCMEHGVTADIQSELDALITVLKEDSTLNRELRAKMDEVIQNREQVMDQLPLICSLDTLRTHETATVQRVLVDLPEELASKIVPDTVLTIVTKDLVKECITVTIKNRTYTISDDCAYQILVEKQ